MTTSTPTQGRSGTRMRALIATLTLLASAWAAAASPVAISLANRLAASPDLAVAPDGTVYLLWVDRGPRAVEPAAGQSPGNHAAAFDVLLARSTDGGTTFATPVRVNSKAGGVWSFPTSRPRIALSSRGTVHVFFTGNGISPANGKPVLAPMYARSTDGGQSFSPSRLLAPIPTGDLSSFMHGGFAQAQAFGTVVAWGKNVEAFWIDTRDMRTANDSGALYAALSTDDGRTFGTDRPIHATGVCPCCQITAVAAPDGSLLLLGSRRVEQGFRDSTVERSTDGGKSFGQGVRLGSDRWKIDGCPLKPTVLAVDGGNAYAAAFNGAAEPGGVRFAASADGRSTFGAFAPLHPEAVVSDAPVLVATGDGIAALWHGKVATGDKRAVFMRRSADRGATWGAVETLSTKGTEAGNATAAGRGDGSIVGAWIEGDRVVTTIIPPPGIPVVTPKDFAAALSAARGSVLVLNLWASWCSPCLKEIPELVRLQQAYARCGVRLLGLAMDDPSELSSAVQPAVTRYFPQFKTLARDSASMDSFASVVDGAWNELMPTSYVIGRDGAVVKRLQGGKSYAEFESIVKPLVSCG